ncbi:MAG: hypothetical protein ACI4Q3_01645 [Kiritimatiellia bacterium]
MTKDEAFEEFQSHYKIVKNWRAKDAWHDAVRDRHDALFDYVYCVNGKDPGPWEMPPVPEGVEP